MVATIPHWKKIEIFQRDHYRCQYCGKEVIVYKHMIGMPMPKDAATVDHIIPKSKGGNNCRLNLITSCKECNVKLADQGEGYPLMPNIVLRNKRQLLKAMSERR